MDPLPSNLWQIYFILFHCLQIKKKKKNLIVQPGVPLALEVASVIKVFLRVLCRKQHLY